MAAMGRRRGWLALALAAVSFWAGVAEGDFAGDQAECAEALVGLSTCLTYVEGNSKKPTPDCCGGLKQVMGKSPECLCILIKDRDNPQLGFKIDAARAVTLPGDCGVAANISECPKLLKLDPNSKDAQVFKQFGSASKQGNATSSNESSSGPGGGGGGGSAASKAKDGTSAGPKSHGPGRWPWAEAEAAGGLWPSGVVALTVVMLAAG